MPDFETYRRQQPSPEEVEDYKPVLTVTPEGLLLNQAAIRALRTPNHLELLYDVGARIIGLHLADRWDADAFEVEYPTEKGGQIAAVDFLHHYGIDSTRRSFRAYMDDAALCANLNSDPL